jgi:hypothetical protein
LGGIDAVIAMSATTYTGRSLLGETLHWALPRLAGYVLAALGAVLAFTLWAVVYTYVWPGTPAVEPLTREIEPPKASDPLPSPPPPIDAPAIARGSPPETGAAFSPISQVPPDALPVASRLSKVDVYDPSNAKVGLIEDVLIGQDGKVVAYILNVGEWYGGLGKYIAVPFRAVEIKKKDDSARAVLFMTKDAVQSAPKQIFDQHKMNWVPYTAPR